jgi:5-methylcytosine-specific restriction protein A
MKAYLFVWNPKFFPWVKLEDNIKEVYRTGTYIEDWSCGGTKSIDPGSRFFLVKLGVAPKIFGANNKGIIGSGIIVSEPYMKTSVKDFTKEVLHVDLRFDTLLNPHKNEILTLDILRIGALAKQHWSSQSSGISIKEELVEELEAVWFDFLSTAEISYNPFLRGDYETKYTEGIPNQITLTVYERNPYARKICLDHYGLSCSICNFNFEQVYGEIGKDFIHVHHLTHIAKIGTEHKVDPINDLRPVCSNCHAMLHRKKEGISIDYIKSLIDTAHRQELS